MSLQIDVELDSEIIEIAKKIEENNGKMYLVGGAVRDIVLGKIPHDFDYCVTGIEKEEFEKIFPNSKMQGKSFPVFILNGNEVALARTEVKTGSKHTDFTFHTSSKLTIEDDLMRRDLTMNSIAIDVLTKKIIDPYGGIKDIQNKILRKTSDAFSEDPLRVYRAARFAAKFGFKIESDTISAMNEMQKELSYLSGERVYAEFEKAMQTNHPSIFFDCLRQADCLSPHFKEIEAMIGIPQPLKYHPEGDVYNHTMEVLERVASQAEDFTIRFCALVHDFGKIKTLKEILPHHYEHEKNTAEPLKEFCRRIRVPNKLFKAGLITGELHMLAGKYDTLRPGTKYEILNRVNAHNAITLEGLELIANCDGIKKRPIKFAKIGNEVMKIKIGSFPEILEKLRNQYQDDPSILNERIKEKIKEMRIKALIEFEKKEKEGF